MHLRRQGHRSLLVAADLRRPAAVEQLVTLGRQLDVPVYSEKPSSPQQTEGIPTTVEVATHGLAKARELGLPWAIVDTGGRLHIDDELMRRSSTWFLPLEGAPRLQTGLFIVLYRFLGYFTKKIFF